MKRTKGSFGPLYRIIAFLMLLGVSCVLALLLGFEIGYNRLGPKELMRSVDQSFTQAVRFFFPKAEEKPKRTINTVLVRLADDVGDVPKEVEESIGGGLTSWGKHVLLITQAGSIYSATSSQDITKTKIQVPDNGYSSYQRIIASPDYNEYTFKLSHLRYNDLLKYEGVDGKGLMLSYTEFVEQDLCYRNVVAQLEIDGTVDSVDQFSAAAEDWKIIYRSKPCLPFKKEYLAIEGHMAGGRLAFKFPGTVYLANGDFHWDGMRSSQSMPVLAQHNDGDYGRVIEIDLNSGESQIISQGHRNPQGIAIHPSGKLFVAEHGPRGGDELNVVVPGKNYGWPRESLGTTYKGLTIPNSLSFGRHDNFEAPLHAWMPSAAISSLSSIEGFHHAWEGDLIAGSLVDKSLYRIRLEGDRVLYSERIPVGESVRYVHQHSDGRLILWTDQHKLHFLSSVDSGFEYDNIDLVVSKANLDSATAKKLKEAIFSCAECHSFVYGDDVKSPSLNAVYGRDIASTEFAGYSDVLQSMGGAWDDHKLMEYLRNPQGFAPGTIMPNPGLENDEIVKEVVRALAELERQF